MFKNLSPSALGISGHESELIELALTFGFAGMDLELGEFASRAKHQGMPYARRLVDSAKVRLGTFRLPFDLEIEDESFKKELEKLAENAKVAAEVNCTRCVTTLPPASESRPYHDNFEFYRGRLGEIGSALQTAGVRLAVGYQAAEYLRKDKPFQFIHDIEALGLLLKMVDSPCVGLLLDVWEVFAGGGTAETIRGLTAEQIVAVQVADVPTEVPAAEFSKDSRLLPGAENGQGNTLAALAVLAETGFDGPVTPKISRAAFHTRRRDIIVKQTGEALNRIWQTASLPSDGTRLHQAAAAEE